MFLKMQTMFIFLYDAAPSTSKGRQMRLRHLSALAAAGALIAPASASADDANVSFQFARYTPSTVTIDRGDSVTWTAAPGNDFLLFPGPTHHPLKFVFNAQPAQTSGTQTSRRFDNPGTFVFYCAIHWPIGMTGKVVVR
jgi:plastocyanin